MARNEEEEDSMTDWEENKRLAKKTINIYTNDCYAGWNFPAFNVMEKLLSFKEIIWKVVQDLNYVKQLDAETYLWSFVNLLLFIIYPLRILSTKKSAMQTVPFYTPM